MSTQDISRYEPKIELSVVGSDFQFPSQDMLGSLIGSESRASESLEGSSTICMLSDSGLECRVCVTHDGKPSTSTLGVLLCMVILLGMAAFQNRHSRRWAREVGSNCNPPGLESSSGEDEKELS